MCCSLSSTVPAVTGQFQTIGCLPYRFPQSCFTRIFYPTSEIDRNPETEQKVADLYNYNTTAKGRWQYTRPHVVKGISKWTGTSETFLKWSVANNNVEHFHWVLTPKIEEEKFPVVIFSHGLGGNADIYSKICAEMASLGYIVIALEHEDGSGSFALDIEKNEPIFYKSPPDGFKYSRETVIEFRAPFLEKRIAEITRILQFLKQDEISQVDSQLSEEIEKKVFSLMDLDMIIMSGHSFGGCTATKIVHDFENAEEDFELKSCFHSTILFDTWPMPLPQEIIDRGIQTPVISFLSDEFHENNEYYLTQQLLKKSNTKLAGYVKDTTHTQYSDGPWFSGIRFIRRQAAFEGTQDSNEFYNAILQVIEGFLKDPQNYSKTESDVTNIILHHKLE